MTKAICFWLKTLLLVVCGVILSQSLQPPSGFSIFNRARCQAYCLTQFPGIQSSNQATCNSADCERCLVPCKRRLQTLEECNRTCANDACKSSCQFIASSLGDEPSYTETIAPLGAPTVQGTNFTSVSLLWQRPSNVTAGAIVYIVEMKYEGDTSGDWRTLNIITSSPFAVVTSFYLCITIKNFFDTNFRESFDGVSYQFRIVALTANTSASRSLATGKIKLPSPAPVENATFNILHYNENGGDSLYFFGKWKPSSDDADNYYVNWQAPTSQCFSSSGRLHSRTRKGNTPNITFNVRDDQRNGCPNTFKVYVLDGCSFSRPAVVTVINHGCRNILNYPPADCCKVHPPEPENQDDLLVRNLKRGPWNVSKDFKFSFNITWDPPVYFEQSGCQSLQQRYSIRYGDPTKINPCFGPFCAFQTEQWGEVKNLKASTKSWEVNEVNQGDLFKFTIQTTLSRFVKGRTKTQINFTAEPNSDELKVQRLAVTFEITPRSVRPKVTWSKPSFDSGFLRHYLIRYKGENDVNITRKTNITSFIVDDAQYRDALPVQVTPVYSSGKFVGISTEVNASPNKKKVQNFQSKWENGPEGPVLRISWDKPATELKILHYVVNYEIKKPGASENFSTNLENTFIIIKKLAPKEIVHLQVTPVFESPLVNGTPSSYTVKTPPDCDLRKPCKNGATCMDKDSGYECSCTPGFIGKDCGHGLTETRVRNLKSEWRNGALHISWDKPASQIKVSYYIVNYEIQKPGAAEKYSVNTTELRVTVGKRKVEEGQWDIKFKVKAVFADPSVKGFFSEDKKAPSTLARSRPSDKELSQVEILGVAMGVAALVIIIVVLSVVICKYKNQRQSYKCECYKLEKQ